ncbi:MAG TPA: D-alanyl-D-alanine carboxypeptidase/D-alanyl-D-alanine-endopeptidase [Pyrinomonadaceae bacterium]|nr:D-alanyl-D-alanine carboxypeptidase/D-alanyl-D-alanine-endopeptidase [Pyrinomonadaceae bacterium]
MNLHRILALVVTLSAIALGLVASRASSTPQSSLANDSSAHSKSAIVAQNEFDATLAHDIDQLIDADSGKARWGVFVMSVKDNRVLYSHDGDKLFTPASNMKIYTTAIALDLLGPEYRWRTSVYASKPLDADGSVDGDLILYGRGAPDLDSKKPESLPALADQLRQRGVRRVRGRIIGDESYFRGEQYGIGWQWNDLQWYYGAQPSALSIDENSVEVTLGPGNKASGPASAVVTPNDGDLRLTNNATTVERDAATTVGIKRGLSNNDVLVWGEFPIGGHAYSAFLSVHNPALRAATTFKRLLSARGIQVDGDVESRDFRVAESARFDPQKGIELASVESATLADIVRKTNKQSNNLYAELILRTLGKEKGVTVPDSDPRKNAARGDDEAGVAIVKKWLSDHHVDVTALSILDGCGLSRLDLITPESAAQLLAVAAQASWHQSFHDSLPIAAHDGTLQGRLTNVGGRIAAKTGSLTYVHSLSGYATTASGEVLVFSIICNDATGQARPLRTIDAIASRITANR